MDHRDAGTYWNENAEAWTRLSRAGYDVYRDGLNTPAFLALLPDVRGLRGLDIGSGEGHGTRLLAARVLRPGGFPQFSIEHPCSPRHIAATSARLRDARMRSRWVTTSPACSVAALVHSRRCRAP
jgi:hypothetical protein